MSAALEWLKRYWEYFAGSILLFLGVFLGFSRKKSIDSSNPVKKHAENKAQADTRKVEYQAAAKKAEALEERNEAVADVAEAITVKTEAVRDDVDQTNAYLQNVSKTVRGED